MSESLYSPDQNNEKFLCFLKVKIKKTQNERKDVGESASERDAAPSVLLDGAAREERRAVQTFLYGTARFRAA